MKKNLILLILTTIPFLPVFPQGDGNQTANKHKKFLHVEAGYIFPEGTIRERISIRQNISYYYDEHYSSGYIFSETSGLVLGIRYEDLTLVLDMITFLTISQGIP